MLPLFKFVTPSLDLSFLDFLFSRPFNFHLQTISKMQSSWGVQGRAQSNNHGRQSPSHRTILDEGFPDVRRLSPCVASCTGKTTLIKHGVDFYLLKPWVTDILGDHYAIFLPHERLLKPREHSLPCVCSRLVHGCSLCRKDRLEITWKLLQSQSAPAYCVIKR